MRKNNRVYLFLLGMALVILACGVQAPNLPTPPVSGAVYDYRYSPPASVSVAPTPEPVQIVPALTSDRGGEMQKWRVVP